MTESILRAAVRSTECHQHHRHHHHEHHHTIVQMSECPNAVRQRRPPSSVFRRSLSSPRPSSSLSSFVVVRRRRPSAHPSSPSVVVRCGFPSSSIVRRPASIVVVSVYVIPRLPSSSISVVRHPSKRPDSGTTRYASLLLEPDLSTFVVRA